MKSDGLLTDLESSRKRLLSLYVECFCRVEVSIYESKSFGELALEF